MLGATLPRAGAAQGGLGEQPALEEAAWEFALVTERAGFDALEADWNDLFQRAGRGTQVFQTFNWNWHWCNHYLDSGSQESGATSLAVVTGRRAGRLVMVWPLVRQRTAGMTQLSWMGEPVSQYGDVLVEDSADALPRMREAWTLITSQLAPDLVRLSKVRDDAAVAPLLAELGALATLRLEAPYLDLASAKDFAEYEQRYSARSRRNRRRLVRRFADRGKMAFSRYESGAEARRLATIGVGLKRSWLKQRGLVSSALSDLRMDRFFADVAEGAIRPAGCQVSVLMSNDEAAAIEITLRCKDRTVMHIIVFDLKYGGAGVLLLEKTISQTCGNGCRIFDLLAPADSYKLDWADAVTGVSDWALPLSLKGRAFAHLYFGFARPALKGMVAALPMSLRRFLANQFAP